MEEDDEEEGGAGWIMTFADLMSLLMCFFVLLLSFSEMDIQKYKQVAGSMKAAFGVQREVKSDVVPKGTTMVTDRFSPGKPDPSTLIVEMRQQTTDDTLENIEYDTEIANDMAEKLADLLSTVLAEEIDEGKLDIILEGNNVSVRIREKDSFPSGSAELDTDFFPVLDKLGGVLSTTAGKIIVGGHSDSIPISTPEYSSNWMLSAARAARVVHYLMAGRLSETSRIELRAYADTQGVAPNDSPLNQAKNRRVEIRVNFDSLAVLKGDSVEEFADVEEQVDSVEEVVDDEAQGDSAEESVDDEER